MSKTVTVKEASVLMGIHPRTIRKLIKEGKLEAYNTGGKYLVNYDSIPAFIRKDK
jgi:excisionase family DNA binding protein